jgi:hypothetical protein
MLTWGWLVYGRLAPLDRAQDSRPEVAGSIPADQFTLSILADWGRFAKSALIEGRC